MNGKINKNFTIFGGTGDLSYRKLIPALYNLFATKKLTDEDRIIAIGRRNYSRDEYIEIIKPWVEKYSRVNFDLEAFNKFADKIFYIKMDFTNIDEYSKLSDFYCSDNISENIFYYAVAPNFFKIISSGICLIKCKGTVKIVVEKPFGETLVEACELINCLQNDFGEDNVYLIDHYLGKEMIQSILTIRFNNLVFKNSWNNKSIDKIEIIASENVGVETRAGYYDKSGALKDMVQNHLMQILSIVAMEEPDEENDIKKRQEQVFKSLKPIEDIDVRKNILLGQYDSYTEEDGVDKNSETETLAICKIFIDNERWKDVPFYIVTGKKLENREMNIIITFKTICKNDKPNVLQFKVQPLEGVSFGFNIKKPGEEEMVQADMDFCQSCVEANRINTPEAYERLLSEIMNSDQKWFSTWNQIFLSWKYIEGIKLKYKEKNIEVVKYESYLSYRELLDNTMM